PSVQTISDGTYPLCTNYYAVLRKDTPTDALAREFVAWLLSEEGQGVAAAAGYVPLAGAAPGETEANEEQWARTHMSSGTGGTEARLYAFYHPYDDEEDIPQIPDDVLAMADAWWAQACMELYFEDYEDDYDMAAHTMIPSMWLVGDEDFEYHDYDENIDVNTALLSMWIAGDLDEDGQEDNFPLRTVVFDIEQKRVLALSDLFFDGVNYIDYINRHTVFAPNQNDSFPGFPNDHPYFIFTEEGDIRLFYADTIPFWQLDWTTFWTPSAFVPLNHWISPWGRCMVDVGFQYRLLPGGLSFPVPSLRVDDGHVPQAEAKINAALADIAERHIAEMDSWAQNVTWVRVGAYTTEHYVRVNFYFRNTDRQTITLSLNMFNLHTGQYFDTGLIFEQWKDSPQAVFIAHERGDESFQTLPGYRLPEGLRPERVSIVSNETGEITLDYYFSATPEGRLWMKVPLFLIEEALAGQ
ncbi:MAG: hypothetical protein FWD25_08025, partial [Clostridia bacterium]|nr:hypothetical protein [Clostridia bacterium]